jgi:Chondroitinase B
VVTFEGKKDQILAEGRKFSEPVSLKNCDNCQLINCDFDGNSAKEGEKMLNFSDCRNCKVVKSKFHDRKTGGVAFNITGKKTKDNIIEESEWENFSSQVENEAEPLRIGLSKQADVFFDTIVRKCTFRKIKAKEPECISIKSCGNLVEDCKFEDNTCSVVVRHGHTNTIRRNEFIGEGGIRVYGKMNRIENNTHRNNKSKDFPPLSLVNGNKLDEDLSAQYTQVRNAHVIANRYEECARPVVWGRDSKRKYRPSGVKFLENVYVNSDTSATAIEFSGGATADGNVFENNQYFGSKLKIPDSVKDGFKKGSPTQPDPIVVPTPEPDPEPIPEPEEDPEAPIIIRTPDNDPVAHLCAIFKHDEATSTFVIHSCTPHAPYLKTKLEQLVRDVSNEPESNKIIIEQEQEGEEGTAAGEQQQQSASQ